MSVIGPGNRSLAAPLTVLASARFSVVPRYLPIVRLEARDVAIGKKTGDFGTAYPEFSRARLEDWKV